MTNPTGLLPAAVQAAEIAERHTARADAERRLAPEVVDALVTAGFARSFVPVPFGGEPVGYAEVSAAVARVAEGCASAAWVASLLSQGSRITGYLPPKGQAEVWGDGPDAQVVVALVAQGRAEAVDGGWLLSGVWPYASGVEFSDWALVLATPEGAGEALFFAVPRRSYTITDSWNSLGMRATGSHSLNLDRVFVPGHCSFPRAEMFEGRPADGGESYHRVPLFAINGLTFGSPVLGAARAALRTAAVSLGRPDADRTGYARSAAEVDAAGLLLERAATLADRGRFDGDLVARASRDSAFAVDLLVTAVDRLFAATGTRGQAETDPLQRIWRDVHTAGSHGVLRFEPAALRFTEPLLTGS